MGLSLAQVLLRRSRDDTDCSDMRNTFAKIIENVLRWGSSNLPLRFFGLLYVGTVREDNCLRADSVEVRRRKIAERISERTGRVIQSGLFAGTALPQSTAWGANDYAAMLLGTYEQELHDPIRACLELLPDSIVNLGCASGLYAAGLARCLPGCPVTANDLAPEALAATSQAWELNHLGDSNPIELSLGRATFAQLSEWLERRRLPLIVCDIEGGERELLDPIEVPQLANAILVCEVHDHEAPGTAGLLTRRFRPTHQLTIVTSQARNPNDYPLLADCEENDRWLAVSEARSRSGIWMVAIPNGAVT